MAPEISVVIPVYRNAEDLRELHARLRAVLAKTARPYEILFVDDASPDGSLEVLRALAAADSAVGVLALERNAGQNAALLAGLAHAGGRRIVTLDADLQDPPEAIPALLAPLRPPVDVIFAGRRGAYESPFRLATSRAWKLLLHLLSRRRVPPDAGLFLAITREAAARLLAFRQEEPYILSLIARAGLAARSIPLPRARSRHTSGYTPGMRWRLAFQGLRAILSRDPAPRCGGGPVIREKIGEPFRAAEEAIRR